ncbi:MAG: Gfo/Idh/MocA family oxidoreductase [Ilumatobacteraceae bacterium]
MTQRLKVGVVGAGIIAQVMHLHYLRELADRFEVVALCDIAPENAEVNAAAYGIPMTFTDWRRMLAEAPIDAVVILTSGSHCPIAVEAANAGKHVLVEKPMCFSVIEGKQMRDAAAAASTVLMVAYPKRYDPAFDRFREEVAGITDPRLLRVTTFEAPFSPYVRHYPLAPVAPVPADAIERWQAETSASITTAIGEADDFLRKVYHLVLVDSLVHELNTVRAVLGEPDRLDYVDIQPSSLTAMFRFGTLPVSIQWLDLPGFTNYKMEFACYGPNKRVTLNFPSPFLRSAPTLLEVEGGDNDTARSWHTEEITSYDSAFKAELIAFHDCVVNGRAPITDAEDAMHDIAMCQSIIRGFQTGAPVDRPSDIT